MDSISCKTILTIVVFVSVFYNQLFIGNAATKSYFEIGVAVEVGATQLKLGGALQSGRSVVRNLAKPEAATISAAGSKLFRKKRAATVEDGYAEPELSNDEVEGLLSIIKNYPLVWLSTAIKNAGDLVPRKNRVPKHSLLNRIEEDGAGKMDNSYYVPVPPFSPRLGRRSEIIKARVNREGQVDSSLFKPRLGRSGMMDVVMPDNRNNNNNNNNNGFIE